MSISIGSYASQQVSTILLVVSAGGVIHSEMTWPIVCQVPYFGGAVPSAGQRTDDVGDPQDLPQELSLPHFLVIQDEWIYLFLYGVAYIVRKSLRYSGLP